jgi:DNA-binding phage protein
MNRPPIGDAIITDLRSQALCLKDALASDSDRAVLHAFEAVARARGISSLAVEAGIERGRLAQVLAGAAAPDAVALRRVVAALIERWEAVSHDVPSDNPERDDLEGDKT